MGSDSTSISQITAAGAYARTDVMAVSGAVRAIDPTRPRFGIDDATATGRGAQAAGNPGGTFDAAQGGNGGGTAAATGSALGGKLLGAVTSFLARMFGQDTVGTAAASQSARNAGVGAYQKTADASMSMDYSDQVMMSDFPRLSSGRVVDLSI